MKLIERKFYLDKLKNVMGTPDIKVLTGVRRSGKSKLLESFMNYIRENDSSANIIHINYNLTKFEDLTEYHKLIDYIEKLYCENKTNYIFIDEIQMCDGFEKAVNNFHASEKYDIYITGSNAFLLSSDLATLFTGRTFEIEVFPFSFAEFTEYFELADKYSAFERYLTEGGMAGSFLYKTEDAKYDYISDVFETLIVRDIKKKYNIRNNSVMERLCDFLTDNISNLTSSRSVSNALLNEGVNVSDRTISTYIKYLCNAFAFYKVRRYDIKGKKYLTTNDKYYLSDHTFKYARLGTKNADYGRMIENIVAIELLRRGYELYAGVLYKKEIDFVAVKRDEKIYIQVSDNIEFKETFEREVSPLLNIRDAYPKIVIARTRHPMYQYEGIKIYDVADWLLNN